MASPGQPGLRSIAVFFVVVIVSAAVIVVGVGWWWRGQRDTVLVEPVSEPTATGLAGTLEPLRKPDPPPQGYVGSHICAECHEEIAERYSRHAMARSMASVADAELIEDYDAPPCTPPGPRRYWAERRDGRVFHHEIMVDKDGQPIYDQQVEIRYVLGSGTRGRAYLVFENGQFFQSSLGWYSAAKKWDLSPGYPPDRHARFSRRLGEGCFYCHVGRMQTAGSMDRFSDDPFPEPGIGCERCHGPGQEHVAFHQGTGSVKGSDPIVNPARLDPARREDVCNHCHLQGEATILRYGRRHMDFRPGQRLEDIWVVFVAGERIRGEGQTLAVSQVQQMRSSACFQKSGGRFGCISCHDPHSEPVPAERVAFYRDRCLQCHAGQGCSLPEHERRAKSAEDSCIECHMPRLSASDVPHTAQTDHRVLRRPDLHPARPPTPGAAVLEAQVFDDAQLRLPKREVDRAKGLAMLSRLEILRDPAQISYAQQLLAPVDPRSNSGELAFLDVLGDDVPALILMGRAFQMLNDVRRAEACWNRLLQIDPDNEDALWWKMANAHQVLDLEQAAAYLDRLLPLNPWDANLYGRKAHILGQAGQLSRACVSAERALELDPTLVQVRQWLVEAYDQLGEIDKKQQQLEILRRMREVQPSLFGP
ncbi:MAG: hypothetical protein KatS3mg110_2164 [Pirellulaceae bacterium]|nr:MAG: hypothetical protein KatS3mg110_2164 [Pirellulaceae bacterium]